MPRRYSESTYNVYRIKKCVEYKKRDPMTMRKVHSLLLKGYL